MWGKLQLAQAKRSSPAPDKLKACPTSRYENRVRLHNSNPQTIRHTNVSASSTVIQKKFTAIA